MIRYANKKNNALVFAASAFLILSTHAVSAQAQDGLSDKEKKQILEAATEQLYAAEWTLQVTPMVGKKEDRKSTQDVIKLVNGKLHSEKFAKEGFEDSNVTVTVGDDRMIVVETMQRNKEDAVLFWRGELVDDTLRGVISKQAPEQEALSYSFKGSQTATVTPEPEPVPELIPEPVPAPESEMTAEITPALEDAAAADEAPASLEGEGDQQNGGGIFSDVFSGGKKDKRG